MSNSEQGISQVHIAAARAQSSRSDGLQKHHEQNIAHLDERIFFFLLTLSFIVLFVVWVSASSALVLYGSLGLVFLMLISWGYFRLKRINRTEKERWRQVNAMKPDNEG